MKATLGAMLEYRAYLWDYVTRYYGKGEDATESTAGKGTIANQAFKRARDLLKAGRNAGIATGEPFNCPTQMPLLCDGILEESTDSTWDYWVKIPTGPRLPAQTHRALKNALRRGGTLLKTCEIRQAWQGWLYVRVFVEFEKPATEDTGDYLGADVGINHGVARSDGYLGKALQPILDRTKAKNAERQRQGHLHKLQSRRSACKQLLDREAKRIVASAIRGQKSIAVEASKTLGNLRTKGSIGAWPRIHLGMRVSQCAALAGVTVREVWTPYSSTECRRCGCRDPRNRSGVSFRCVQCGVRGHADTQASQTIRDRGRAAFLREREKGTKNMDRLQIVPAFGGGVL